MANGIQNMYLPVNGTAVAAKRMVRISYLNDTGWYKFFEFTLPGNNYGYGMTFMVKETYSNNAIGIVNFYVNFTSSGGFACYFNNIATTLSEDRLKYKRDGYKITLYYNKTSNSVGDTNFTLITSHARNGGFWDTTSYWMAVKETPDSTAVNVSNIIQNKAQYAIGDTNGDQIDTTYLKSTDAANTYLPATSASVAAGRLQNQITLTGNAGWYKIIEFTIETTTNASRNFILMASESTGVYSGIFKVDFRRTSATAISANIRWLVYDGYALVDLAYSADATTGVCAVYIKKAQSSTYYLCVQCLYCMTRTSVLNGTDIGWSASGPLSVLPENAKQSTMGGIAGRALQVAPSITWTGAAGWYKVYEESFNTNVNRTCQFLISDAAGYFTGILNLYYMRTSTTAVSAGARWLSMTGGLDKTKDAQYTMTIENEVATFSLYLRKRSASTQGMRIVVLAATTNTGETISVRQFFNPVSATLPSTAVNAAPPVGVLRFDAQTVSSGSNAQIISISNTAITDYHVLERIEWANPEYITTGYTWTTEDGAFKLTGTCTAATTANILLVRKGN